MRKISLLLLSIVFAYAINIQRDTLSNGLVILTVEAHKLPMIEMRAVTYAGSVSDPAGQEGIANLVSQILLRGTKSRASNEIAQAIESVGGEFFPFTDEDHAGISGRVLSKDLYLLIDLLSDCIQNPLFDSVELFRIKSEVISQIKAEEDRPFSISKREFRRLVFSDNPLSHLPQGYDSTIGYISQGDIREFYSQYYLPNNTFFVFVGDFQKDSLMLMLKEKFGNWERRKLQKTKIDAPSETSKPLGKIIHMDISQAYILLGNLGPKYGDADWYETRVMNYILGGSQSTSRMGKKIRQEKGLAYIVWVYFQRFKTGGYFTTEVQTKKEMADEVVQIIISEMERIQDTIDVVELSRAKKFYTGYFPLTHDTYREMTSIVSQIESQGLGLDYLLQFEKLIEAVKMDELKAAAQKYLHPDRFYLLIVGDLKPEDIKLERIEWIE
ncbi:insulinase family protein [candidate division WOR-3 bacterium]|nr:insulinase family protein [candidate division WOR-3 bacterium]